MSEERKISPQGYNYTEEPLNENPFWDSEEGCGGVIPEGGETGQVLGKASDADYDLKWISVSGGGTVDNALSLTSENPVQNKVITESINNLLNDTNTLKNDVEELEDKTTLIKENVDNIPVNYYNKTQTDNLLNNKVNNETLNNYRLISDSYSKTQTDAALNEKADKTELNKYALLTDSYTKTEINSLLDEKISDTELTTELQNYRTIADSYSKSEVNSLLTDKANSSDLETLENNINTALNNKVDTLTYQTKIDEIEDNISDIDAVLTLSVDGNNYTYTPAGSDLTVIIPTGGGGGGEGVTVITMTSDGTTCTLSKTIGEAKTKFDAGKPVYILYEGESYRITDISQKSSGYYYVTGFITTATTYGSSPQGKSIYFEPIGASDTTIAQENVLTKSYYLAKTSDIPSLPFKMVSLTKTDEFNFTFSTIITLSSIGSNIYIFRYTKYNDNPFNVYCFGATHSPVTFWGVTIRNGVKYNVTVDVTNKTLTLTQALTNANGEVF